MNDSQIIAKAKELYDLISYDSHTQRLYRTLMAMCQVEVGEISVYLAEHDLSIPLRGENNAITGYRMPTPDEEYAYFKYQKGIIHGLKWLEGKCQQMVATAQREPEMRRNE